MKTFKFVRDAGKDDWVALPHQFKTGETVFEFIGHTYGLVRDDLMYGNRSTVACKLEPNATSFFTVPCEFIVDEHGKHPRCEYMKFPLRTE